MTKLTPKTRESLLASKTGFPFDAKASAILNKKKSLSKKTTKAKSQVKKAATMMKNKANVVAGRVR